MVEGPSLRVQICVSVDEFGVAQCQRLVLASSWKVNQNAVCCVMPPRVSTQFDLLGFVYVSDTRDSASGVFTDPSKRSSDRIRPKLPLLLAQRPCSCDPQ